LSYKEVNKSHWWLGAANEQEASYLILNEVPSFSPAKHQYLLLQHTYSTSQAFRVLFRTLPHWSSDLTIRVCVF
jgi:hypothetical protein